MGKVRKLRKKYKALCSKNNDVSSQKSSVSEKLVSLLKNDVLPAAEPLSSLVEDTDHVSTTRSTYSISKSIKSSLGGMSIQKKEKQKLRHELFLKRLDASKEAFNRMKMEEKKKKRKEKQITFKDDLPPLKLFECNNDVSNMQVPKLPIIEMKHVNKPRKGTLKYRNQLLGQNVNLFKDNLKSSSLMVFSSANERT